MQYFEKVSGKQLLLKIDFMSYLTSTLAWKSADMQKLQNQKMTGNLSGYP